MKKKIKDIKSDEDLKGLVSKDIIRYTCRNCGKDVIREYRPGRLRTIKTYLCKYCNVKNAFLTRYGVKVPLSDPKIKEKMKQSNLVKYGSEYIGGSKIIREKIEATNMAKYGVKSTLSTKDVREKSKITNRAKYGHENPFGNKEIQEKLKQTKKRLYGDENYTNREKAKETNKKLYGVEHHWKNKDIRRKIHESLMKHYGVEHSMQSKEVKERLKQTNMKRYGVECTLIAPEIQEKIKQTNLRKYGVERPMQSKEVQERVKQTNLLRYGVVCAFKRLDVIKHNIQSRGRKYSYNGEKFDSSWELALWIYAKDHNEDIVHDIEPLEYYDGDKKRYYFPDFRYKGELIEVKGDQFVNDNGILFNIYDSSQNDRFAAKQQCALEHGVRFMFEKDLQFAIDYARNKFGGESNWYIRFSASSNNKPLQLTPLLPMMPMYIYPTIPMMLPWWMFMTPCDFNPYITTNVFEREGMEFVDCECSYE